MSEERLASLSADIFGVANSLLHGDNEAAYRSVTTRAYYAVLSLARVVFHKPLEEDYRVHKKVKEWISEELPSDDRNILERASALYLERIAADYNLLAPFSRERAQASLDEAATIFNALAEYANERNASEHPEAPDEE